MQEELQNDTGAGFAGRRHGILYKQDVLLDLLPVCRIGAHVFRIGFGGGVVQADQYFVYAGLYEHFAILFGEQYTVGCEVFDWDMVFHQPSKELWRVAMKERVSAAGQSDAPEALALRPR